MFCFRPVLLAFLIGHAAPARATAPAPLLPLTWIGYSGQQSALMGAGVSSAGDVNGDGYDDVLVGLPWYDGGQLGEGQVQVYLGSALGLDDLPAWTFEPDQGAAALGFAVSGAGDVNGDGYDDVVVGSRAYAAPEAYTGRAWLFLGSVTGLDPNPAWEATGPAPGSFGGAVAGAGDVNGDGYDDVVVGAYELPNSLGGEGRVYVYLGSATGLDTTPAWTAESAEAQSDFGVAVDGAGDVDGDGYDDVIVGAQYTSVAKGSAYLYRGSASGLEAAPTWIVEGDLEYCYFGHAVASAGDVNGDGYDDVAVGAYLYEYDEGRAWVYLGSATGPSATADVVLDQDAPGARFGQSLGSAGDVDADGYDDLVVGAPWYDGDRGRASVFRGSAAGLETTPVWDEQAGLGYLGYSVGSAGDVDGDGVSDLLVGASLADGALLNEGAAIVYRGACEELLSDEDGDGVDDRCERCPGFDDTLDGDADGIPDACDSCPAASDPRDIDVDGDLVGDACDLCPGFDDALDEDGDGVPDGCDPDEEVPGEDTGAVVDTGGPPDEAAPRGGAAEGESSGCGCDGGSRGAVAAWVFALVAVGARRRRR